MAYDEDLADRIRELLVDESDVTEKKMFGGLAFLIRGNMAIAECVFRAGSVPPIPKLVKSRPSVAGVVVK